MITEQLLFLHISTIINQQSFSNSFLSNIYGNQSQKIKFETVFLIKIIQFAILQNYLCKRYMLFIHHIICTFYQYILRREQMSSWLKNAFKGKQQEDDCQYENENASITFSDMKPQHMKKLQLGKYDPNNTHLCVTPGLNLQGMCRNQSCKVFQKMVWVKLGYGVFNINYLIYNVACPICKHQLPYETVLSLGYTRAIIKAEGKVQGQAKKKWQPPSETEGKFIKFEGYDGATSRWSYLNIQAIKP